MNYWLFFAIFIALSACLTGGLRYYANTRNLIDIPNARSSHTVPTPRGGGVAIVISFMCATIVMFLFGALTSSATLALIGSGGAVAALGFLDDHGHVAARWRLLGHFTAAAWALFWLNGLPPFTFFTWTVNLGWIGHVVAIFYLIWLLNLYNFMDGIDGLASVEAICVCAGGAFLYYMMGNQNAMWPLLCLAATVLGFLFWNFPPAKIFMGDAGSGFLGMILGVFSLQAAWYNPVLLWSWLILLGVFIVDATFTLLRRLFRGDKVYEAHRSHAYQYASRHFNKHLPVTLSVLVINLLWLFPISYVVTFLGVDGLVGVMIAYVPLIVLAIKFKAGTVETAYA